MVNLNQLSSLHSGQHIVIQRFWGHNVVLLESRDVIGHMTIGLTIYGFLQVVNLNGPSISHGF